MPIDPLTILAGGSAALNFLRGSMLKKPRLKTDYLLENDPEFSFRKRRLNEEIGRDRMRTQDELSRAGLTGSSAAFDVLGEQEARGARGLEDLTADITAKRRMEALRDFDYDRDVYDREKSGILDSLMDAGSLLGQDIFSGGNDVGNFLPQNTLADERMKLLTDDFQLPQLRDTKRRDMLFRMLEEDPSLFSFMGRY